MKAIRHKLGDTGANLMALLAHLDDAHTDRVILFATETHTTGNYSDQDTNETNLPGLVALTETKIAGIHEIYVVFDGNFLSAARKPRYLEVRELLDRAVNNPKVFFSTQRSPFTGNLSPDDAAQQMINVGSLMPLTENNRPKYFQLLSGLSEKRYAEL